MNLIARSLGDFAKLQKATINFPAFIKRISMKFHVSVFYENLSRIFKCH